MGEMGHVNVDFLPIKNGERHATMRVVSGTLVSFLGLFCIEIDGFYWLTWVLCYPLTRGTHSISQVCF